MSMRKKIFVLYALGLILLGVVLFLALRHGDSDSEEADQKEKKVLSPQTEEAYRAVPSDAVLIFDFEQLGHVSQMLKDTSSFAYGLIDSVSSLGAFQDKLFMAGAEESHSLFSLH